MTDHHVSLAPLLGRFTLLGGFAVIALVIDDRTGISIGSVGLILSCVWWLGRKLQRLEDGQREAVVWRKHISKLVEALPCKVCTIGKHDDSL